MCKKCVEIDGVIERYRHLQRTILDQVTVDRAKALIIELLAQKAALHPMQGSTS
jgi:orotate phosphoribosyltransferase-like protein